MQATNTNPSRAPHRSTSPELAAAIQPVKEAAATLNRRVGRFAVYEFLKAVYRVYTGWKRDKTARRSAHLLADKLSIARRKGMSPIRVLIEATLPDADLKQKSRWVRALEYVAKEATPVKHFRKFIGAHGGLAGCARLAANMNRKRRRPGCDWND
jgi:hypothetical protein